MNVTSMAAFLRPTILGAIQNEFADDIDRDEARLIAQAERLAEALAQGIAAALVPYLTNPATTLVVGDHLE